MKFNVEKFINCLFISICVFVLMGGFFAYVDVREGVITCFLLALGSLCSVGLTTFVDEIYKAFKK